MYLIKFTIVKIIGNTFIYLFLISLLASACNSDKVANQNDESQDTILANKNIIESEENNSAINEQKINQESLSKKNDSEKNNTKSSAIIDIANMNLFALANKYYEKEDFEKHKPKNTRGNANSIDNAINQLAEGDNNTGEQELLSIIKNDDSILDAHFYLALLYYNQKKFDSAILHLEKILDSEHYFYDTDKVEWTLLISYLSINNRSDVDQLLAVIQQNPNHKFKNQIVEIANTLKEI